jgi:hypothetical protein
MQQRDLFNDDKLKYAEGINPKLSMGKGPTGKYCRDCDNKRKKNYHDKTYYKCTLVGDTNGAGTDIRLKWPACFYFKETP